MSASEAHISNDQNFPRYLFSTKQSATALRVPSHDCALAVGKLRDELISRQGIKRVQTDPMDDDARLVILGEDYGGDPHALPDNIRKLIDDLGWSVTTVTLQLDWTHFTAHEILRELLPADVEVPSAFESAGHVAHLNLRKEHEAHKHLIGQVLLEKNSPRIRTVVNKQGEISSVYRTFPMEILAGEADLDVSVVESDTLFRFRYDRVYWNSRLQQERRRVLKQIKPGQLVADMFAGVGPFAIPSALHRNATVFANDLNPESARALQENAERNKVPDKRLTVSNMDASEFVASLVRAHGPDWRPDHVIMNLPDTAVTFLGALSPWRSLVIGADSSEPRPVRPVRVHCYLFSSCTSDPIGDARVQVASALEKDIAEFEECSEVQVTDVRKVSPIKTMLCVEFNLQP